MQLLSHARRFIMEFAVAVQLYLHSWPCAPMQRRRYSCIYTAAVTAARMCMHPLYAVTVQVAVKLHPELVIHVV